MAKKLPVKKNVTKKVVVEKITLSKKDLVDAMASGSEYTKETIQEITTAAFAKIGEELVKGNNVSIYNFGVFSVKDTEPRTGRNPSNGEAIQIPAGKRISFKASSVIKNAAKENA